MAILVLFLVIALLVKTFFFSDSTSIKNVFIAIQKNDFVTVFCNMSYRCKNFFISLKLQKMTFNF